MSKTEVSGAEIATYIREAILEGEFVPNQRLIETDLCEAYSATRTAVRSALVDLASEGIIERVQNRGARVRAVSLDEAIEIAEVRMAVEGLLAYKAAQQITDQEAAELTSIGAAMQDAVSAGHLLEYSAANKRLHARIGEIAHQTTANQLIERIRAQVVRHHYRLAMQPGRPHESLPEHLEIIDAICARDPDAAETALRKHLRSVIAAMSAADERRRRGWDD